jgi:hypothetical protein
VRIPLREVVYRSGYTALLGDDLQRRALYRTGYTPNVAENNVQRPDPTLPSLLLLLLLRARSL